MVAKIYDTEIRVKYILRLLHQILVFILKFLIKNHKQCIDKVDLGKSLAEVLKKNEREFKKTKLFSDPNYKRHFCLVDPHTNNLTNALKATVDIESLDIAILTLLITKKFIFEKSHLTKCCSNCKHNKCSCGLDPKDCPNKANCGLSCSCKVAPCDVVRILKFCSVARSLRNCFAHATDVVYQTLQSKRGGLEDFPLTKTWTELWTMVNDETLSCLKTFKGKDLDLLSMEDYKDFKMDMRIAFRKHVNFLLPEVESSTKHYYETILGESITRQQISKIDREIFNLRKG